MTTTRAFTYDGAGNILTDDRGGTPYTYTYNNRNRLATAAGSGQTWGYAYNTREQLVSRQQTVGGSSLTHFVHDRFGNVIAETSGVATGTVREYIWLPETEIAPTFESASEIDRPLAVVDGVNATPALWMVHVDHLNRPIRMTNAAKAAVWDAVWLPWGGVHAITGSAVLNARLPGQWFQLEAGLHYNWHRQYDPTTGRYTQPDPLGFVDGPSVYGYAGGSPQQFVDPTGEVIWLPILISAGAGAGLEILTQLIQNRGQIGCIDWTQVAITAVLSTIRMPRLGRACGGGNSFDGDTLVWTKDGSKPIRDIVEGDEVLAWDPATNRPRHERVAATTSRITDDIWHLTLEDASGRRSTTVVTGNHPYLLAARDPQLQLVAANDNDRWDDAAITQRGLAPGGEWRVVRFLQPGDKLRSALDAGPGNDLLTVISAELDATPRRVYNLEVENLHSFAVGPLAEWVHNSTHAAYLLCDRAGKIVYAGSGQPGRPAVSARAKDAFIHHIEFFRGRWSKQQAVKREQEWINKFRPRLNIEKRAK